MRYKLLQDRLFIFFASTISAYCIVDPIFLYWPNLFHYSNILLNLDLTLISSFLLLMVLVNKIYISVGFLNLPGTGRQRF